MDSENPLIKPKELMDELHIDYSPEEETTIGNLIATAKAVVDEAIEDLDNEDLQKDPLYISAIKSFATQLYYDRTLSAGKAPAVKLLIAHLQFKYGDNHGT